MIIKLFHCSIITTLLMIKTKPSSRFSYSNIFRLNLRLAILWIASTVICAAESNMLDLATPPQLDKAVPTTFQLESGFNAVGKPAKGLGIRRMDGAELPKAGDVHPIYVTAALKGVVPNDPLLVGDVIMARPTRHACRTSRVGSPRERTLQIKN